MRKAGGLRESGLTELERAPKKQFGEAILEARAWSLRNLIENPRQAVGGTTATTVTTSITAMTMRTVMATLMVTLLLLLRWRYYW